jgi:hypothetical protein
LRGRWTWRINVLKPGYGLVATVAPGRQLTDNGVLFKEVVMKRPRKTVKLSKPIHRQLNAYALAAGAAGVGVLAFAQPAEARIVYTPADKWIPLGQNFYVDLNHDGINDFRFWLGSGNWSTSASKGTIRSLNVQVASSRQTKNAFSFSVSQSYPCVPPRRKGKTVGPKSPFSGLGAPWLFLKSNRAGLTSEHHSVCRWLGVKEAYLGVRFLIEGKTHYGWIRLGYVSAEPRSKAKLTGYAYETTPNKPIITGNTKGPDDASVKEPNDFGPSASLTSPTRDQQQPATLGILAFGAQGVALWRRKDNESAVQGN